jgi:hypothetical protein
MKTNFDRRFRGKLECGSAQPSLLFILTKKNTSPNAPNAIKHELNQSKYFDNCDPYLPSHLAEYHAVISICPQTPLWFFLEFPVSSPTVQWLHLTYTHITKIVNNWLTPKYMNYIQWSRHQNKIIPSSCSDTRITKIVSNPADNHNTMIVISMHWLYSYSNANQFSGDKHKKCCSKVFNKG